MGEPGSWLEQGRRKHLGLEAGSESQDLSLTGYQMLANEKHQLHLCMQFKKGKPKVGNWVLEVGTLNNFEHELWSRQRKFLSWLSNL